MSDDVMIRLYDTFGAGAYVEFAKIRPYQRPPFGFKVEILQRFINSGKWRRVAVGRFFEVDDAVDFICENSLAAKPYVKEQLEKLKERVGWL